MYILDENNSSEIQLIFFSDGVVETIPAIYPMFDPGTYPAMHTPVEVQAEYEDNLRLDRDEYIDHFNDKFAPYAKLKIWNGLKCLFVNRHSDKENTNIPDDCKDRLNTMFADIPKHEEILYSSDDGTDW